MLDFSVVFVPSVSVTDLCLQSRRVRQSPAAVNQTAGHSSYHLPVIIAKMLPSQNLIFVFAENATCKTIIKSVFCGMAVCKNLHALFVFVLGAYLKWTIWFFPCVVHVHTRTHTCCIVRCLMVLCAVPNVTVPGELSMYTKSGWNVSGDLQREFSFAFPDFSIA